jgi:hypothetical protein
VAAQMTASQEGLSSMSVVVVVLERGPLSLVSITKELLVRNSSGSGLENREYRRRDRRCRVVSATPSIRKSRH